ncbi:peptidase U32 [Flexistipes sinusarabici DSM 4947]|uniref:Peptidase U32 n=1 Tax=Flexistipes sinusarabici (strain ATCC 49648 / DSM 4947 / MAS 10) TaxID=717231 RepID=F8E8I2_FLESM|nr:U32 family peptidase [Flexistipes sinusarabici]AEI14031.1 peptidase U32 [Flexistipes sinusarabici DSM 4947]
MKNVELLSPAGNFEKLRTAVNFGADAVYLSGKNFGLRAKAANFEISELEDALSYLHSAGKKGYVTANIYPRNDDFEDLKSYIGVLAEINADAVIISDPGILHLIKQSGINIPVHISTQSNTVNYMSVKFWEDMGASRVILARELSKEEIGFICKNTGTEIEMFVHGAMCISHSGRCVLSNYFTGKDANRGECTHPCRWNYYLVEKTRPGEYLPVVESDEGTFIYNSRDLCLLEYIDEIVNLGVASLKIEGRMKSAMYTGVVTGVYRQALDKALRGEQLVPEKWMPLLESVSNRGYTTGFFCSKADEQSMNYSTSSYYRNCDFIGVVTDFDGETIKFICKTKLEKNENIHFLDTDMREIPYQVQKIYDDRMNECESTKPNFGYYLPVNESISEGALVRRYK